MTLRTPAGPLPGPPAVTGSLCLACRHLRLDRPGRMTCDAFPLGVPRAIREGRADHRRPYSGDDGIRFEATEYADEAAPDRELVGMT